MVASSLDVAVMVTVPALAGAVQAPLAAIVPGLADQTIPFVVPPVAVVLNVVALFTVTVGAGGVIAFTTTVSGVTVTEASRCPAALAARR